MAFVIAPKSSAFTYPVEIPFITEQGSRILNRVEFQFKRLTRTKFEEATKAHETPKDENGEIVSISADEQLELNVRQIMEFTEGWKGVSDTEGKEVPFSEAALRMMLDNYPAANGAIVSAYVTAYLGGEAKRKN